MTRLLTPIVAMILVESPTMTQPGDYYDKEGGPWPGEVGPFHIEGATPDDTLVVKILKVQLNRATAVSFVRPSGLSALATDGRLRLLNDPLPTRRFVWQIDSRRNVATLDLPASALHRIEIPLHKVTQVVGVGEEPPLTKVRSDRAIRRAEDHCIGTIDFGNG